MAKHIKFETETDHHPNLRLDPNMELEREWSSMVNGPLDLGTEVHFDDDAKSTKQALPKAGGRANIRLLVADDHVNPHSVGGVLSKLGFEVIRAKNGAEALERMSTWPPDLVLIDLLRSDIDGLKLCRRIRENSDWAGIPVMIHASAGDKGLATRAFDSGAADCMTKSSDNAELVSRIHALLSGKMSRDSLKQLAADKEESLDILFHDLKNHLVGMQMSSDILQDVTSVPDATYRRLMLENISRSSGQMLSFVNRFLANASANRQLVIKLEPVSFSDAAARSVQQFQEAARRKELVVHAFLSDECTLVQADPNALDQVLDNLLSNAVKFSPSGKQISVLVRPAPGYVECQIRDQGNGFTPEDKKKMFRRFGRLSARPTGNESSSGLGLSIVKKLMEAMSGEVNCESTAGSGSMFSIRLPRAAAGF